MMGIYPSYYQIGDERKQLIGTQFETTFARQAFPSIDEPEAKATFDLAIKFDEQPGETILANKPMPPRNLILPWISLNAPLNFTKITTKPHIRYHIHGN